MWVCTMFWGESKKMCFERVWDVFLQGPVEIVMFLPSHLLKTYSILVRDGQFSGGMHPQNSSTRGNKGLSEMPKFWQFFLICCQFFGRSGTVKNTDRETWNRKTGTFSIDVSARPLHTRQLSMQIQRMTGEGRWSAASSCQKIGTRDPMQGCQFFGRPKLCAKGMPTTVNEESATVQQSRFYKNKKDIAEKVQYVWLDLKKNAQKGEGTLISRLWRPEKWKKYIGHNID